MKRGDILRGILFFATLVVLLSARIGRAAETTGEKTVIIQLKGEIDDYSRDQLFRRFDEARKFGAKNIILNLDSYGGLVTAGEEISRYIKRQTDLHIIAFVQDKAISAGAMIAMACDEIVMSNSSTLGDCAPIVFGPTGLETMGAAERAKAESTVLLDFDESAKRNHRDPLLAAAMVDVKRTVYWVQNAKGERKFVDETEYAELTKTKEWVSVPGEPCPIDGPTTLLTVDGDQAVRYGLASEKANSAAALAQSRGYDIVADLTPGVGENLVETLNGPLVRGLLIIVFLQCLYIVLHAPGHGVAEICGLAALGLMLGVPMLTGYAQWWEILMIFVGLLLISVEIVLPGHFVPGITGAVMVFVGLVMTFVPKAPGGAPSFWPSSIYFPALERGIYVVAGAMVISLMLWIWLNRFLPKMPLLNRIINTATSDGTLLQPSAANVATPGVQAWPPVGAVGKAVSELRPGGLAEFFDPALSDMRVTAVVSESGYLPNGSEISVRELSGPSVVVRKKA
jgi:membrane-bound serine protease (ClpP class)